MFGHCNLVPEKFQAAVNLIADGLLVTSLKTTILQILEYIQKLIICATGIDILLLLQYLTILAVVVWLYNLFVDVVSNYLCFFKCKKSSSSSCSSSRSSSSSSSCSSSSSSSSTCKC